MDANELWTTVQHAYGHATGDAALKHFSNCLKACVRATDTVARLAGDEFVVLLPGLSKREDAELVARKIIRDARLGLTVDGKTIKITTSIGIAFASDATVTSEALFASADRALYAAKNADRDAFDVVECNVIEMAQRPSRRRGDVRQRSEVGSPPQNASDSK